MKIVAVSQRVDVYPDRSELRDAVDQRLIEFIASCGGLAFSVPNTLVKDTRLALWLHVLSPDAIVLSGGNDIGECLDRDSTELQLLEFARLHKLPALGICRGMQMMGLSAGGKLKPVTGHVSKQHQLIGEITGIANSFHNHALVDCPVVFQVLAKSTDGEIEAIRHIELPWEGWMWHPEREELFSPRDIQRFKDLIQ